MKIKIKNLGVLQQAEFELGDMTIICGQNNTGKSYAAYALYGFLVFWQDAFIVPVEKSVITDLQKRGSIELDLNGFAARADHVISEACKAYAAQLPWVFASAEKNFEKTEFSVHVDGDEIAPLDSFERTFGAGEGQGLYTFHTICSMVKGIARTRLWLGVSRRNSPRDSSDTSEQSTIQRVYYSTPRVWYNGLP